MQNRDRFTRLPIITASLFVAALACTDEVTAPMTPGVADRPSLSTTYVNGNVTITDLGTVPGTIRSVATDINDAGVIVGQGVTTDWPCTLASGCGVAVMWPSYTGDGASNGFVASCQFPQHSAFRAINTTGTSVGDATCGSPQSNWVGFARDAAGVTRAVPEVLYLDDINDAGIAVGTAYKFGLNYGAAKWDLTGSSPTMTELRQSIPGATATQAFAINGAGAIALRAQISTTEMAAVLWPDGSSTLLGMLPGTVSSWAEDINDDGVVVGYSRLGAPTHYQIAFVWSAGDGMRAIGSLGPYNSRAMAINEDGIIVGNSNTPAGPQHAFAFKDGVMIDLGTLPGHTFSSATGINESGEIVGSSWNTGQDIRAVRWTVAFPSTPGSTPPGSDVVVTPNDASTGAPAPIELTFDDVAAAGTTTVTSGTVGSGSGGPPAPSGFRLGNPPTYYDVETTAVFTGSVTLCFDYSGASYGNENILKLLHYENGVWTDVTTSLDTANDTICGTVTSLSPFLVAEENAAPIVTTISLPGAPVPVGTNVMATASFTDANPGDAHTATIGWDDGSTSAGAVTGSAGSGKSAAATHAYLAPGVFTIAASVSDGDLTGTRSSSSDQPAYIVVYDPTEGFVTGGGWIDSPHGACLWSGCASDGSTIGKASFGFVSRYKKGATVPSGSTEFQFNVAGLTFRGTDYQWLVISGARAQYKGTGQIVGDATTYGFILTAIDGALPGGGGTDRFRIKLWNIATGDVVYDNQMNQLDDSDAATAIGGGSVVIHK